MDASHATLDPDRACSAAQDGTLSISEAAIRWTQMMKAGDTFLYVRYVVWLSSFATIRPLCIGTMSPAIDLVSFVLGRLPSRSERSGGFGGWR
jgi:hypothetical protein